MFTRTMAWTTIIAVALGAGCSGPPSRLNAPPQGYTETPAPSQEVFTYMGDNALLADMSIADVHFVSHTSEMNSLGLRRLDRYASLLKTYGGTIRYSTGLADAQLVETRIQHVKQFLTEAGVDPQRFSVETGLPGGRGLAAEESSIARKNLEAKTEETSGGGAMMIPMMAQPTAAK